MKPDKKKRLLARRATKDRRCGRKKSNPTHGAAVRQLERMVARGAHRDALNVYGSLGRPGGWGGGGPRGAGAGGRGGWGEGGADSGVAESGYSIGYRL